MNQVHKTVAVMEEGYHYCPSDKKQIFDTLETAMKHIPEDFTPRKAGLHTYYGHAPEKDGDELERWLTIDVYDIQE